MSTIRAGSKKASNEIFIGKKPLMTYVTATLVQLANEPTVVVKARGKSITRAVDVAQIIVKRMNTLGYKIGPVKVGSDLIQSEDGRERAVSTIEVSISRAKQACEFLKGIPAHKAEVSYYRLRDFNYGYPNWLAARKPLSVRVMSINSVVSIQSQKMIYQVSSPLMRLPRQYFE